MTVISADLHGVDLVSDVTGLVLSGRRLNYLIVKTSRLADISIPEGDGGILKKTGVVDVFCSLCAPDEASFVGGEFIIIRCENGAVWELLIGRGYMVNCNGEYVCIYLPYHYMGPEMPISILLGNILGLGTHSECRQASVMTGVVQKDMPKGVALKVQGHHHPIGGPTPELQEFKDAGNTAPFYLLSGVTLPEGVKTGQPITKNVVDLSGSLPHELYNEGLKL